MYMLVLSISGCVRGVRVRRVLPVPFSSVELLPRAGSGRGEGEYVRDLLAVSHLCARAPVLLRDVGVCLDRSKRKPRVSGLNFFLPREKASHI